MNMYVQYFNTCILCGFLQTAHCYFLLSNTLVFDSTWPYLQENQINITSNDVLGASAHWWKYLTSQSCGSKHADMVKSSGEHQNGYEIWYNCMNVYHTISTWTLYVLGGRECLNEFRYETHVACLTPPDICFLFLVFCFLQRKWF